MYIESIYNRGVLYTLLTRLITATGGVEWNSGGAKADDGWNSGGNATGFGDDVADAGGANEAMNGTVTNGGDFTCRRSATATFSLCSSPVLTAVIVAVSPATWLVSAHQLPRDRATTGSASIVARKGEHRLAHCLDLPS